MAHNCLLISRKRVLFPGNFNQRDIVQLFLESPLLINQQSRVMVNGDLDSYEFYSLTQIRYAKGEEREGLKVRDFARDSAMCSAKLAVQVYSGESTPHQIEIMDRTKLTNHLGPNQQLLLIHDDKVAVILDWTQHCMLYESETPCPTPNTIDCIELSSDEELRL